jgi:hypothetical protein
MFGREPDPCPDCGKPLRLGHLVVCEARAGRIVEEETAGIEREWDMMGDGIEESWGS